MQRPVRCECSGVVSGDWLIVAGGDQVVLVCRCGRRHAMGDVALHDLAAMVEAEPVRAHWTTIEDALDELGFAATAP